jgi:hypothetical protein
MTTALSALAPLVEAATRDLFVAFDGTRLSSDTYEEHTRRLIERRLSGLSVLFLTPNVCEVENQFVQYTHYFARLLVPHVFGRLREIDDHTPHFVWRLL